MTRRPSRWISATARTTTAGRSVYEAKEASEVETAEFLATQPLQVSFSFGVSGGYVVARNSESGQVLVSGEHCLTEANGWVTLHKGDYSDCMSKVRELRHARIT